MNERGVALFMVLVVTAFLSAITIGTVLAVFMDRLATGNVKGAAALLHAADAGVEIAARDMARIADWDAVLSSIARGSFTDGTPGGARSIAGRTLDLTALTNALNCGRTTSCTAAQMDAASTDRPFGPNNPHWRLFEYGPFSGLAPLSRPVPCYLVVWIADDSREQDGNPAADAAPEDDPGHGIVRVRAETFGAGASRRAIEAEFARGCAGASTCPPGIRVQSWQEVRVTLP